MHGKKARFVSHSVLALAVMFGLVVVATQSTQAQTFTVLYSFTGGSDGDLPESGVVQDASGNLYGTTFEGGNVNCGNYDDGCGVVYEVSTAGTETVLHTFCQQGGCGDGANPRATVIRDMAGNLYGTGYEGGKGDAYGTVFKIDTAGNETVLQSFHGQAACQHRACWWTNPVPSSAPPPRAVLTTTGRYSKFPAPGNLPFSTASTECTALSRLGDT